VGQIGVDQLAVGAQEASPRLAHAGEQRGRRRLLAFVATRPGWEAAQQHFALLPEPRRRLSVAGERVRRGGSGLGGGEPSRRPALDLLLR